MGAPVWGCEDGLEVDGQEGSHPPQGWALAKGGWGSVLTPPHPGFVGLREPRVGRGGIPNWVPKGSMDKKDGVLGGKRRPFQYRMLQSHASLGSGGWMGPNGREDTGGGAHPSTAEMENV